MAVINAGSRFALKRAKSTPMYKLPKNVRQSLNIDTMSESGMGKLTPGQRNCLYDRCYIFEEINYINKDISGKEYFLNQLMGWLKTMNVDFKIVLTNEYQSVDEFLEKVRADKNRDRYREADQGINEWIGEKLADSNPNVSTVRYLAVSCRADTVSEANIVLNALDTTISDMFRSWHSRIIRLDGMERLKCLHSLLRIGKKGEEEYISFPGTGDRDWKNDILPGTIRQHSNFLELDNIYMSVLYGGRYRSSLESDTFIRSFSNLEFPSFVTMDFAPVAADIIEDKLVAASMNNERAISEEEEKKRRNNTVSNGPSYPRQRKKEEIEGYMDQVGENDETGFFMNFLVVVTAEDEMTLAERVGQIQAIGTKEGAVMETADYQQLKALMTALPFGGRQVDYMRFFLSSSIVAFQPYYAQDIIEPGGFMYGLNRTTKRLIIGNRKLLMNPHGIIIGHSGSGKSVIIKATEILQTLLATDDDILILDPQNEFAGIVTDNGGSYFDLTPKSGIYLNGFEVSEEVFYAGHEVKEKFIASQVKYAKSLLAAIMSNIVFTQEHSSIAGRCARRMFDNYFAGKNFKKQPTLKLLRMEIGKELEAVKNEYDEKIIRPIYNSLEEYTEGSCDMLAHPSTVKMNNRLIGFGLKNVPEENWEAVMITIMHYTSARMEYNQNLQRATHFIVDETQVVSKKGTSADQLNTAVATFRKFGGICTMAMQNLTAALENDQLKELFSNCSYKCFLDQGGVDANALAEIQELSQTEFNALASEEVGQGVMVWGKKVVLFDAKISKENTIYPILSTNFHEKAEKKVKGRAEMRLKKGEQNNQGAGKEPDFRISDRGEEIILSMAEITSITAKDVLTVLDISHEEAQKQLEYLCSKGALEKTDAEGRIRYRKGV